jgi:hypothetical protein
MKTFFSFLISGLIITSFAKAQVHAESPEKREEKVRAWLKAMDEDGGDVWLTESSPQVKADNEKSFFAKLTATGSGNGGDPLAQNFIEMAKYSVACGLLESLPRKEANILDHSFYRIRVFSVPFNLCIDDTADCDFATSFTAKNFPDKNTILVNAVKWNSRGFQERVSIAMHEVLGILRIEQATYGRSTSIKFKTVRQRSDSSFSMTNYCWIEK